eukprot:TRINITY_DN7083_c0_g1_i21.p2 TRINITY_DN7083_c0_g1~~TRINITY_DN7083_c0_g1_i21.p2  ORF type:complete len:107 (-),score=33.28 TRINITY_DN7083_c0_g1_i21:53-373(-)
MTSQMSFCPTCASLLLIEEAVGSFRFYCRLCPYVYYIARKIVSVTACERKQVDDILGGSGAWKDAPQTNAVCGKCGFGKAFCFQMQTRSADEPMTCLLYTSPSPRD